MPEQHIQLKKLLVVLVAIMIGAIVFAVFSLYKMKTAEMPVSGMPEQPVQESPEKDVYRQLNELSSDDKKSSEEDIQKQLDVLKEGGGTATATEWDIRKQLDELDK